MDINQDSKNLILIEFLVDKICFEYATTKELENIDGETCVSFQFLDKAPICIYEEDFMPKCPADISFVKCGKSCLFSLTSQQKAAALKEFNVYVEVYKKQSDKLKIGDATISMTDTFADLIGALSTGDANCTKTVRDFFMIYSNTGDVIGIIGVFIRLSCFEKQLVTEFQMNVENKSVDFKVNRGHYLFKYCKKGTSSDSILSSLDANSLVAARNQCCSQCNMTTNSSNSSLQVSDPSQHKNYSPNCSHVTSSKQYVRPPTMYYRCNSPPVYHLTLAETTNEKKYQEIEALMGDCGGISVRLYEGVDENNEINCSKPMGDSKNNTEGVCVISPKFKDDGVQSNEIIDYPEMYVLRVGNRTEKGFFQNNRVDLEFCTPIPHPKPNPPVTDTKRMQYDPADLKSGSGGSKTTGKPMTKGKKI